MGKLVDRFPAWLLSASGLGILTRKLATTKTCSLSTVVEASHSPTLSWKCKRWYFHFVKENIVVRLKCEFCYIADNISLKQWMAGFKCSIKICIELKNKFKKTDICAKWHTVRGGPNFKKFNNCLLSRRISETLLLRFTDLVEFCTNCWIFQSCYMDLLKL